MSKVRTFSRVFPITHIKEGQPTFFVEKILRGLSIDYSSLDYLDKLVALNKKSIQESRITFTDIHNFWSGLNIGIQQEKHHTIRSGFNIKAGENISPRVWLSKPYNSPQIIIWDDLKVARTQEFYRDRDNNWLVDKRVLNELERGKISWNDGLLRMDMNEWFNKEIHGQIICWSENIEY